MDYHSYQFQILLDPDDLNVMVAGRQTGKTTTGVYAVYEWEPGFDYFLYVTPSNRMADEVRTREEWMQSDIVDVISFDEYHAYSDEVDEADSPCLIVDEAGYIDLPTLSDFVRTYSRILMVGTPGDNKGTFFEAYFNNSANIVHVPMSEAPHIPEGRAEGFAEELEPEVYQQEVKGSFVGET